MIGFAILALIYLVGQLIVIAFVSSVLAKTSFGQSSRHRRVTMAVLTCLAIWTPYYIYKFFDHLAFSRAHTTGAVETGFPLAGFIGGYLIQAFPFALVWLFLIARPGRRVRSG